MIRKIKKNNGLIKIGEMAHLAGLPTSTIRYYSKIGLLEPAEVLPSGYRLYEPEETLRKIQLIRHHQSQKPTLAWIKALLSK